MTPETPQERRRRLRRRKPRVPAPLRLGDGSAALLEALVHRHVPDAEAGDVIVIRHTGQDAHLSRRGARELAKWLDAYLGRPLPALCAVEGIADRYRVSRRSVEGWRKHPKFPKPVEVDGGRPVFETELVADWVAEFRPRQYIAAA